MEGVTVEPQFPAAGAATREGETSEFCACGSIAATHARYQSTFNTEPLPRFRGLFPTRMLLAGKRTANVAQAGYGDFHRQPRNLPASSMWGRKCGSMLCRSFGFVHSQDASGNNCFHCPILGGESHDNLI